MRFSLLVSVGLLAGLSAVPAPAQTVLFAQNKLRHYSNSLAPYIVSPQEIVDRMLEIADLKPGETLYDLGSGDGRVLITAAQRFRAKAVGIEISDSLVRSTTERVARMGLQDQVRVIHADLLQVDLSPADVVTMYFPTESNISVRPNLEKYLHPGARVVSHDYSVPGWKPNTVENAVTHSRDHKIYLYVMPAKRD